MGKTGGFGGSLQLLRVQETVDLLHSRIQRKMTVWWLTTFAVLDHPHQTRATPGPLSVPHCHSGSKKCTPSELWRSLTEILFFKKISQECHPLLSTMESPKSWSRISRSTLSTHSPLFSPGLDLQLWCRLQVGYLCSARMMTGTVLLQRSAWWETRNTNLAELSPCWATNSPEAAPFHQQHIYLNVALRICPGVLSLVWLL